MSATRDDTHEGWSKSPADAEQRLELPTRGQEMVDALARGAPPPRQLRALRCSALVDVEALPDRERETDGA